MTANLARTERQALADLFDKLGPDVPTLCEGWDTGDLLAHLLVRERRIDASAGMFVKPLAGHLKSVTGQYRDRPWADQVALLRSGPPPWNPMGWGKLDELTNGSEFFIHHEDARRGVDGWEPRLLDDDVVAALTALVESSMMRMMVRRLPAGLTAQLPDGRSVVLKKPSGSDGTAASVVTVAGDPGEIVLWVAGRDACRVQLNGDESAVAAVVAARGGL
ncbi:TIGR03085 family metal-binding protein [Nakamurella lactea]|uniref:TIGR03085 family metal-binding protein n=1 Tax=Nakamurella lactea TaxID=459515 RepID=UPI0003F78A76|nr:TIGR03085 family metal-binding protein [Nakamurella lactea]